jgi:DNA-binding MarR family transcriptional regulator
LTSYDRAVSADQRILRGAIFAELGIAARYGNELVAEELRKVGVDSQEYGFLSFIGVLQPVTRTRLAAASGIPRTTLRDRIRQRVDQGHIREEPHPADGRATLLSLTKAGQSNFDRGHPAFMRALRRLNDELEGALDEHEEVVWRVRVALQRIADRVEAAPRA